MPQTHTHTRARARKHTHTHARAHSHARTHTRAHTRTRTHTHTRARARTHARTRTHAHTHTHDTGIRFHTEKCVRTRMCLCRPSVCLYWQVCAYADRCVLIQTRMSLHRHTHTHDSLYKHTLISTDEDVLMQTKLILAVLILASMCLHGQMSYRHACPCTDKHTIPCISIRLRGQVRCSH